MESKSAFAESDRFPYLALLNVRSAHIFHTSLLLIAHLKGKMQVLVLGNGAIHSDVEAA